MNLDKKSINRILLGLAGIVVLYWALMNYGSVLLWGGDFIGILSPIILGMSMAFLINIPMRALEERVFGRFENKMIKKSKRAVSLILSLLLVVLVFLLVFFIVIPELGATLASVAAGIPALLEQITAFINQMMMNLPEGQIQQSFEQVQQYLFENWQQIINQLIGLLDSTVTIIAGSTIAIISGTFSGIFNFVVAFVLAIYALLQKERLAYQFKKVFYSIMKEESADRLIYALRVANSSFNNFFTGQFIEAIIIGVLFFISMSLLGFPYALVSAVIIGATALIPIFGAFIGCIISAFFILVTAPQQVIPFIILFLVIQQLEGNLIYPKVVGGSVGLPAIWVLIAVSVGGSLMGVLGMLTMVPVVSVVYILLGEFSEQKVKEKKISEEKYS